MPGAVQNKQTNKLYYSSHKSWPDDDDGPSLNRAWLVWWRSVKGFWRGKGSNFGLLRSLATSALQHSRTTMRLCDLVDGLLKGLHYFDRPGRQRQLHFHYRMMFAAYILMFLCSLFMWPCDLDLWPIDLDGISYIKLHTSNARTILSVLWLSVPELWLTRSDHIWIKRNGHCAMSRYPSLGWGAKIINIFEIHDSQFIGIIHLVTLRPFLRRLSNVIEEK